jgi:hypothetical protein
LVNQLENRSSDEIFYAMAKQAPETSARKLDNTLGAKNCDQFLDGVQQRGELLRAKQGALREGGALRHLVAARDTNPRKNTLRAKVSPASSV